jgi:hypothetical protein
MTSSQATMDLLQTFKKEADPAVKNMLGQQISDLAFWSQWLIRGVLFEGACPPNSNSNMPLTVI